MEKISRNKTTYQNYNIKNDEGIRYSEFIAKAEHRYGFYAVIFLPAEMKDQFFLVKMIPKEHIIERIVNNTKKFTLSRVEAIEATIEKIKSLVKKPIKLPDKKEEKTAEQIIKETRMGFKQKI